MTSVVKQANCTLPEDLLDELKRTVPKGEQSKVVGQALRNELKRIKFKKALDVSFEGWKEGKHPELAQARVGSYAPSGNRLDSKVWQVGE